MLHSVIVSVNSGDVTMMGSTIRLFTRSRTIERTYSSNRYTQCRHCWGFGHVATFGLSSDPSALSARSTTSDRTPDVPTPPSPAVATLWIHLAAALPHRPAVSTVGRNTPPCSNTGLPVWLLLLSLLPSLPRRYYLRNELATK